MLWGHSFGSTSLPGFGSRCLNLGFNSCLPPAPKTYVKHMAEIFDWKTSPVTGSKFFNLYTWWRDPEVVTGVGDLLAEPFRAASPAVVIGHSRQRIPHRCPRRGELGRRLLPNP